MICVCPIRMLVLFSNFVIIMIVIYNLEMTVSGRTGFHQQQLTSETAILIADDGLISVSTALPTSSSSSGWSVSAQ
jgi:hypothetical protein